MTSTYQCKEIDLDGKVLSTSYKGETKEEVVQMIRSKGHTPVKVEAEVAKGQDVSSLAIFQPRVKVKDISVFCKQLHTMLHAGMPLISALDVLQSQSENKVLRSTVKDMAIQVQKGEVLSTSMKRHRRVFPPLLVSMVEAGEMTGNLDNVLERMAEHFVKENRINNKVKGAMMYPVILSIIAVVVVIFMLLVILPNFLSMFVSKGTELPLPTRILLGISDFIKGYWYLVVGAGVVISVLIKQVLETVSGKRIAARVIKRIPIVGSSSMKIATSRFTRTLSTLLGSGITIIQGLETSAAITGNQLVIDGVNQVIEDIKKGSLVSSQLKSMNLFPPMMISMISIGEESGSLEEMLEKTADFYDEELEASIQRLVSMIEPLMIVVMALIIGFLVVAMMLPMFTMFETIG